MFTYIAEYYAGYDDKIYRSYKFYSLDYHGCESAKQSITHLIIKVSNWSWIAF